MNRDLIGVGAPILLIIAELTLAIIVPIELSERCLGWTYRSAPSIATRPVCERLPVFGGIPQILRAVLIRLGAVCIHLARFLVGWPMRS